MKENVIVEILSYVKDEFKEVVEKEVKEVSTKFCSLTQDERDEYYNSNGLISFLFDEEQFSFEIEEVVIDKNNNITVCELICDYVFENLEELNLE